MAQVKEVRQVNRESVEDNFDDMLKALEEDADLQVHCNALYDLVPFVVIWYHLPLYLHNLKNVKNTHGGALLLVKLQLY